MWLKAAVPENDIAFVRIGQEMEIRVTALPDRMFKARVSAIGAMSDASTRRIIVRAELPNPDGALRAEMFATFKLNVGGGEQTAGVPSEAVVWDGQSSVVWVQKVPGVFQRREVKLGLARAGLVQVKDGLSPGEAVIARGAIFVDNEWRQ